MIGREPTSDVEILEWLRSEYLKPFTGWDFSFLQRRRTTIGDKPWDYETIVLDRLALATHVLDVDTGDGGRFAEYLSKSHFFGQASVTEGYLHNVPIARAILEPLGVEVREGQGDTLPFSDASFDLVVNRHGLLDLAEDRRVLQPRSWLVTEQVGSQTNLGIHRLLDAPLPEGPEWNLQIARVNLEADGFQVHRAEEHFPITHYTGVGALVWYLKAIPWQIPDFAVDKYANRLLALHRKIEQTGTLIDVGFHLFLLVAERVSRGLAVV